MQDIFFDTCALLNHSRQIFNQNDINIYISIITLKELENIKTSSHKDSDIKYKARKLINLLSSHQDKYTLIDYPKEYDNYLLDYSILSDNNDSRIILSAVLLQKRENKEIIFATDDLCCKRIAEALHLAVKYSNEDDSDYKGYLSIKCNNDNELSNLYENIYSNSLDGIPLLPNEYLIIKDSGDNIIDKYKNAKDGLKHLDSYITFNSKMFGKIKPKDTYQLLAMDSFKTNKITLLRGAAGTGKSFLSISFLLDQLQHGAIDKIIIFCNTVATNGSAKLGLIK